MNRRGFLRSALGVACAAVLPRRVFAEFPAAKETPFRAADRIFLGPRKIECSRLFLGTGSNGWNHASDQTRQLGTDGASAFLREGLTQGITSWDAADLYGSHPLLARALAQGAPRKDVTIMTKSRATTADEMRADIARFLRELGTDYLDILLLHCVEDPKWNQQLRGAMDVIDEYQKNGVIRSKGVSCHTIEALRTAAAEPWVEIDLARINPYGVAMDGVPEEVVPVLREMKSAGKGVIGMKIFGAGELANRRDECLRYALNLDCVDAFSIGCTSTEQRDDVAARIARAPLRRAA